MGQEIISETFGGLPAVTSAEVRLLDQLAEERYGLSSERLMENAGKAAAREIENFSGLSPEKNITFACGRGLNGGDGLVIARILKQKQFKVSVFICPPKKDSSYPDLVLTQMEKAKASGVSITAFSESRDFALALKDSQLAVDAILGVGSSGKPTGCAHFMIQEIAREKKPVIAIDIPSGLNPDTGYHSGAFIAATETLTIGLPKRGLLYPHAQKNVGILKVLDIGYPPALVQAILAMRDPKSGSKK